MRRLSVFESISLDGYFSGVDGDLSWAYEGGDDPEFAAFVSGNAQGGGALVLGRVTFEMMRSFWPTAAARQAMPEVAEGMNRMEKIVFSRSLDRPEWENARIVHDDPVREIRRIKAEEGSGLTILGSGSIVALLAGAGLIDALQLTICPVVLGSGRPLFEGIPDHLRFKLIETRSFANGKCVGTYEAAR